MANKMTANKMIVKTPAPTRRGTFELDLPLAVLAGEDAFVIGFLVGDFPIGFNRGDEPLALLFWGVEIGDVALAIALLLDFLAFGEFVSWTRSILLSMVEASLFAIALRTPLSDADKITTELFPLLLTVSMSCFDFLVTSSSKSETDRLLFLTLDGSFSVSLRYLTSHASRISATCKQVL